MILCLLFSFLINKIDSRSKNQEEKNEIEKLLKPLKLILLLTDLLFIVLMLISLLNFVHLSQGTVLILIIFGILNAAALLLLDSFQLKINNSKKKKVFKIFSNKAGLISAIIFNNYRSSFGNN